jgi:hypothetical protein
VRAVVVCRPPGACDSRRLSSAAAAEGALSELEISDPVAAGELPADAPDADLCRDVAVGREAALRLPLYGHGGAPAEGMCRREVAPLLRALVAGESAAVIAYGQTGGHATLHLHCPLRLRRPASSAGEAAAAEPSRLEPPPSPGGDKTWRPLSCALPGSIFSRALPLLSTGSGKSYTMGTEKYEEGQGPAPHSGGHRRRRC